MEHPVPDFHNELSNHAKKPGPLAKAGPFSKT